MPLDILYRLLTRIETVTQYELEHVFVKSMDHGNSEHPAACEKILEYLPKIPNLLSAYKAFYGAEPPFTTRSKDFSGVLDYIFMWGSSLSVKHVRKIHDIGEIPNGEFPSDHLPVIATLIFSQ